jgi:hypothetical protein
MAQRRSTGCWPLPPEIVAVSHLSLKFVSFKRYQLLSLSVKHGILWGKLIPAFRRRCDQTALNIICL